MLRKARLEDLDALVTLEESCFDTDRLSRRSFRYLLTRGHATTLVEEEDGRLLGYALLLFHRGTALARLYSIAVSAEARGRHLGATMLAAAEREAVEAGTVSVRSEVRKDNVASRALFSHAGYRQFDEVGDYYEDGMAALRFEKNLDPELRRTLALVPFYRQTLDFTCGAAALLMAMKALRPGLAISRGLELKVWREATSIFMTSGHGGCGPYGLALAAAQRGFGVEVYVVERGVFLGESVRSLEKREVMRLVEEDFLQELRDRAIPVRRRRLSVDELRRAFEDRAIPLVLISSYRIYGERVPHWVVVTGFDERFIYVHDPFISDAEGKSESESVNVPIARAEFERMARYGKTGQRAVLLLRAGAAPGRRRAPRGAAGTRA